MKLHLVSFVFAVVLTTSFSAVAQQDTAQYYANWVKALPYAKTVTDWVVNFDSIETAGTIIATGYDKFTAPKFEDNAAGYAAEQQYYEAVAKSLQPLESWATAGKTLSDWAGYLRNPKGAVATYAYNALSPQLWEKTDEALKKAAAAEQQQALNDVRPQDMTTNSTPMLIGQSVSDWGGTTSQSVQATNNATQAWGSSNDGSWQCAPSQWNSQNSPVAWPKN
jgi:hypothetical protein